MDERTQINASADDALLKVLRAIEANPQISQRALAESLGMSLGRANYCLKTLVDKRLVKMRNFRNSQNKLAYAYLLTPNGLAAKSQLMRSFLVRKMAEFEALKREIEELNREFDQ